MPLPPLPDEATVNSAGHISDSVKQENYLRALAEQYKIDIGNLPDPDPGHSGHVDWHNTMTAAAKKVAAAIGAKVTLPPVDVKDGDLAHVTHHNLMTKALGDMSAAVPFSVEGGTVTEFGGWRVHSFAASQPNGIKVTGTGKVTAVVIGGGGGQGYNYYQNGSPYAQWEGGTGGGGGVAEVSGQSRTAPEIVLTPGTYDVVVGKGGAGSDGPNVPGGNGESSSFIGSDVSLIGAGGGGGGSADVAGQSAGTGGGGGAFYRSGGGDYRVSQGGTGNPAGRGSPGTYFDGMAYGGAGGGSVGDARVRSKPQTDLGGLGFFPDAHFSEAAKALGYDEEDYKSFSGWAAGGSFSLNPPKYPGMGGGAVSSGPAAAGYKGIVQIAYKISDLLTH